MNSNPPVSETTEQPPNISIPINSTQRTSLTRPKCPIIGKRLPTNQIWLSNQDVMVCITADSTTYDKQYGDSHRKVAIYNTASCQSVAEWTLPVNTSPDFPYYLAEINYNTTSNIVAIKGVNAIYCLDVNTRKILPPVKPKFLTKRAMQDVQSGTIIRLELWEDYLLGYAQDMGAFVFEIQPTSRPKAILPYAEYKISDGQFNSVFLLPSADNKMQVILPQFDWEEEEFSINPLFDAPVSLQKKVIKSALNNRFLVLRSDDPKVVIGLDLKKGKRRILPPDIQTKGVKTIVDWMMKNG